MDQDQHSLQNHPGAVPPGKFLEVGMSRSLANRYQNGKWRIEYSFAVAASGHVNFLY